MTLTAADLREAADWYVVSTGTQPVPLPPGDRWAIREVPGRGWVLSVPGARDHVTVVITVTGQVGPWPAPEATDAEVFDALHALSAVTLAA